MQEVRIVTSSKVSLAFRVGSARPDGSRPLDTVSEMLDVHDEVIVRRSGSLSPRMEGEGTDILSEDSTSLAFCAVGALHERFGASGLGVEMATHEAIPTAGGMTGESTDAAGALVALNALQDLGLPNADLMSLGSKLGSDVPFCIMGGIVHGTECGEILTPVYPGRGHAWVLLTSPMGPSTSVVFRELDHIAESAEGVGVTAKEAAGAERPGSVAAGVAGPGRVTEADVVKSSASTRELREAVARGDLQAMAAPMASDLQAPASSLRPDLEDVVERASRSGAMTILLDSGSTIALLTFDPAHANHLAMRVAIEFLKLRAARANGPIAGTYAAEAR